jgi:hypothetical protein
VQATHLLRQRDPIYKTAILEIVPATPLNMRPYFGGVPAGDVRDAF